MQRWLIALVLVAITLVVYAPIVLGGSTWRDARYQTEIAPSRIAAADAVLHGEAPTWWDGSALGVPLLAEPSHGAAYPIGFIAATPLTFDLLLVAHLLWCTIGIALLARRLGASDLGAVVAGALVATSGVLVASLLQADLPAVAHLPWIALAALRVSSAPTRAQQTRATIALAALLALVGLAGSLAALADAIVVAAACLLNRQGAKAPRSESEKIQVMASRRLGGSMLLVAIAAGLAIASVQWLPAFMVRGEIVGSSAAPLELSPWLATVAPLIVLAVIGNWRLLFALVPLAVLALVRDAVHAPVLVIVAAAYAGRGFDRIAARIRMPWRVGIVAAVLAPTVIALPVQVPTTDRALVAEPSPWARAGSGIDAWPRRLYRPVMTFPGRRDPGDRSVEDRIATLGGTSAAKWGIGAARSDDPARSRDHDRVWAAARSAGGALFGRYGIALAILPASMVGDSGGAAFHELSRRAPWALVEYPASPTAAIVHEWIFAPDVDTALARLFPPGSDRGLSSGVVVLAGHGSQQQDEPGPAQPCKVLRWDAGAIDVECTADRPAYHVISSSAARGWSVTVDGRDTPWLVADVIRRAVPLTPGTHRIEWRYAAPGLRIALVLAALGILALVALWLVRGRDSDDRDRAPDPERTDLN